MSDMPQTLSKPATQRVGFRELFKSQRRTNQLKQTIIILILAVGAIIMIMPFEWMIATSFSRSANVPMPRVIPLFPTDPSWFNYQVAATNLPLARLYLNSFIVTAVT